MLHLVTLTGQPIDLLHRRCERCGTASGPFWPGGGSGDKWTSDEEEYKASLHNCERMNRNADLSQAVSEMTPEQHEFVGRYRIVPPAFPSIMTDDDDAEEPI